MPKTVVETPTSKVLMVAYVFPPIAFAGTYRTLRFCRYLPQEGWHPEVLTIKEGDDLDLDYSLLDRIPSSIKIHRTWTFDPWRWWNYGRKGLKPSTAATAVVKSTNSSEQANPPNRANFLYRSAKYLMEICWELITIPDHMNFWVIFASLKGIRSMTRNQVDLIYTSSPPHSEHLVGLLLAKMFRKPWVADFRDPILDSSGYDPATRIRKLIDRKLESIVVHHADKILIISDRYKDIICQRYPAASHKFITMPNGFDPELFEKKPAEPFPKFTIIYAGSFYLNRKPDFFLMGLNTWLKQKPVEQRNQVQVLFYGPPSPVAQQIVFQEHLEEIVSFKGMVPQANLISKMKGAHLLLLIIGFDPESFGTVTSKVFEYMACQRPILAIIPEGEASKILQGYDKFYWVDEEDERLLLARLDQAYEHYTNNHPQFLPNSDFGSTKSPYDARIQTGKLAKVFSHINSC